LESTSLVWKQIPAGAQSSLRAQLSANERLIGVCDIDLNGDLRFDKGLVIITDARFLFMRLSGGALLGAIEAYPIQESTKLQCHERAGVGSLELMGAEKRLAEWRYTAAKAPGVHRLLARFNALRAGDLDGEADESLDAPAICPACGSTLPPGEFDCPACIPSAAPPTASSLFRLARFAKRRMNMIVLGLVLSIASTALNLVPTIMTQPLTDDVLRKWDDLDTKAWKEGVRAAPEFGWRSYLGHRLAAMLEEDDVVQDIKLVVYYLSVMFGAAVFAWFLDWVRTYVNAWVSERIAADLRNTTYEHMQKLSLEFFGAKRTGDLMARISSDTDRICYFLSVNLLDFITDMLMITMIAIWLLYEDHYLAMAALIPLPLIAWLVTKVRQQLGHGFAQGGRAWAEMTSVLADTIPGVRVVKAFAQESRESDRFRQANDHILTTNDRVNRVWAFFYPMVALLTEIGVIIVYVVAVWRVAHSLTIGAVSAAILLINKFYARLDSISRISASTQRASASSQRLFDILDRVPSVAEPTSPVPSGDVKGQIEFNHVGFKYGSRPIIQDVNLSIQPGEMIGLVGPSGSGKSTLVNLVCRFYDVGEGVIFVDGKDIRQFGISDYRRHIGIVLQEPFLFFGTIAENVAYGRPDATREEIVAAAKAAKAHEFILRLADGYDSLVGERGQSLSGGERQRISIARALLIDPAILILDEATSAVDTETEREIQEALDYLIQGRTTIAIAHRLSTLRKADRIVVLERGRVVETGKHQELLDKGDAYFRLHQAQMQLAAGEPVEATS
jgi:ATP-binding cassette subfamily B protein